MFDSTCDSTTTSLGRGVLAGAAAGAAGTAALNAMTYLDMAVRGRGASSTPETTVTTLADKAGVTIPGDEETRSNRVAGLGPLMGLATGTGVGALAGGVRAASGWRPPLAVGAGAIGLSAMAGTNLPMAGLGVSDPRTWSAKSWLMDLVPHVVYGTVTAAVLRGLAP